MISISTLKHAAIAVAVTFGAIYVGTRLFPRASAFLMMPGAPWLTDPRNLLGMPSLQLGFGGASAGASRASGSSDPDAAFMV